MPMRFARAHGGRVTTTPHDALFKAAFSKVSHARGLLRALVPEAIGQTIAWSTLRLESGIAVGHSTGTPAA